MVVAVQLEKTQQNLLHGLESFDKSALKPTETMEKIILPATEGTNFTSLIIFPLIINRTVSFLKKKTDIVQEKGQQQLRQGIETFDPATLKHAETQEKNPLPTQEGNSLSSHNSL